MRTKSKKLSLNKETTKVLTAGALGMVVGGATIGKTCGQTGTTFTYCSNCCDGDYTLDNC